jgi:hypothetical protein
MKLPLALICTLAATATSADITVTFRDGAPKDRFTITQNAPCPTGPGTLTIDLGTAPVGLIFDTTGTGAGVQVFQPFAWVSAPGETPTIPKVGDGDTALTLDLPNLEPQAQLVFTIDIDDTGSSRQSVVSGSEVAGAQVTLTVGGQSITGRFDATGTATIAASFCTS